MSLGMFVFFCFSVWSERSLELFEIDRRGIIDRYAKLQYFQSCSSCLSTALLLLYCLFVAMMLITVLIRYSCVCSISFT